jgi:hypothetical protein
VSWRYGSRIRRNSGDCSSRPNSGESAWKRVASARSAPLVQILANSATPRSEFWRVGLEPRLHPHAPKRGQAPASRKWLLGASKHQTAGETTVASDVQPAGASPLFGAIRPHPGAAAVRFDRSHGGLFSARCVRKNAGDPTGVIRTIDGRRFPAGATARPDDANRRARGRFSVRFFRLLPAPHRIAFYTR